MAEGSHVGRPSSWIAVGVMLIGFAAGGLGLVLGPSWPLFWVGVAIAAVGGVAALAVGILSDVVVYAQNEISFGAPAEAVAGAAGAAGAETTPGKTETAASPRGEAPAGDAETLANG
ncbi:MAG TPA: HGxxPAAW family protein [Streptosporangiaceae bacterium]|nr:HGxxPAAW family protein [Streptosporangiaceae bacterium]